MSSELHLDPSPLTALSNLIRARAALTVCDRVRDKWPVIESLLALGLIEPVDGIENLYVPAGGEEDRDGVVTPWSMHDRGPAATLVARLSSR